MSTLIQENGKTQEEMDVDRLVRGPNQPPLSHAPTPGSLDLSQQEPAPPAKKKPFIPPLLGAKNLGMSTLIGDNGKTQEEMDVDRLVKGNHLH